MNPEKIYSASDKKVWWKCRLMHEWLGRVADRTRKSSGCPYCSGNKVLTGFNDFATQFPYLAKEWNYSKNGDLLPTQISSKSSKKVWWVCSKGHEWAAVVASRTNGRGCPYCHSSTSFLEQAVFYYLKRDLKDKVNNREYLFVGKKKIELDIYISERAIGIEYDGIYWHRNKEAKDNEKTRLLDSISVVLIRIRESDTNYADNNIIYYDCHHNSQRNLEWAIAQLETLLGVNGKKIDISADTIKIMEMYKNADLDKNLALNYPDIAKEWNYEKNGVLLPETFSSFSGFKVWWKCNKGHEWKTSIRERTSGTGCPYCSNRKVLVGYNDLATVDPGLASEWNFNKNKNLLPTQIVCNSNKQVWWKCNKGHEWIARPADRYGKKSKCPFCSNRKLLRGFNDLATTNPELVGQWDYLENGELKPFDIMAGSSRKVWWICSKGHKWEMDPNSRVAGSNCPYCSNQQVLPGYNDLATTNKPLAKEWDYEKNKGLSPTEVVEGSSHKVWWICQRGHRWKATLRDRKNGSSCPYCTGVIIISGETDFMTKFPKIAREWNFDRNGKLLPSQIGPFSGKKVWWKCAKGHEWEAIISSRTYYYNGCPVCANKQVLAGYNDLLTTNPELAAEWNFDRNDSINPTNVTLGSNKKVWWRCLKGHEWEAVINSRKTRGCPYCSGKKVLQGFNDLETLSPLLTKEWNFEKNGHLRPFEVTVGSAKKVWWKCAKGHEWEAIVSDRFRGSGCPKCSVEKIRESLYKKCVLYVDGEPYKEFNSVKECGEYIFGAGHHKSISRCKNKEYQTKKGLLAGHKILVKNV